MQHLIRASFLAAAMTTTPLLAQAAFAPPVTTAPPGAPPATLSGYWAKEFSTDPSKAPAGSYRMSGSHAAIFARVAHNGGVSYSVFRFNTATGTLDWNQADPTKSKLNVSVDTKSLTTNVPGFATELIGENWLNSAKYPTATFVSTSAVRTGKNTGRLTGDFTLMGQTRPLTFDVTYVGGSPSGQGVMNMGFNAKAKFKRSDFGFTTNVGPVGDEVELVIDTEFGISRNLRRPAG